MSRTPRVDIDPEDSKSSIIKMEAQVVLNKIETQKQIDSIIKGFKKESITRKQNFKDIRLGIINFSRKTKTLDIESEISKITATAEVRLTRNGKSLSSNYEEYLGKIGNIFTDIQNASSRLEVNEVKKTLKEYKGIVKNTRNLSRQEKREIKNVIKETEYAIKAVKSQKLSRGRILSESIKNNLPDIAGITAAIFGDNPLAAWAGGVAGDYMRQRKELKKQEKEKRLGLFKDERDKSIGKSIDLRRDRDDEILNRRDEIIDKGKSGIKKLFTRKPQESPIESDQSPIERDYDISSGNTLTSTTIRDGVYQALVDYYDEYKPELKEKKTDVAENSKLKRDEFIKGKTDAKVAESTAQTATGTQKIVADIAETKEVTKDSNKSVKETSQFVKEIKKAMTLSTLWAIIKWGFGVVSKNEDQVLETLNKYGKVGQKAAEFTKKAVNLFRTPEEVWKVDMLGLAMDQKEIQLAILRLLGGDWSERKGGKERPDRPSPKGSDEEELLKTFKTLGIDFKEQKQLQIEGSIGAKEVKYDQLEQNKQIIEPLEGMYELMLNDHKILKKKSTGTPSVNETIKSGLIDKAKGIFGDKVPLLSTVLNKGGNKNQQLQLPAPVGGDSGSKGGKGKLGGIWEAVKSRKMDIAGVAAGLAVSNIASSLLGPGMDPGGMVSKTLGLGTDIAVSYGLPALMTKLGGFLGVAGTAAESVAGAATGVEAAAGVGAAGAGIMGTLGTSVGALPVATTALGVGAAGAVGYGVGTLINKGMDSTIAAITGGKNTSLGDWMYDFIHPKDNKAEIDYGAKARENLERNRKLEEDKATVDDGKSNASANIVAQSVSSAVTNIGGSSNTISMPVSAYDNDKGTNLLSNNFAA